MANPVIVSDIESRWRPLSVPEQVVANALLGDAWAELLVRVPLLEQRIADGALSESLVVRVVSAMVLRVLKNAEGMQRESQDDYSYERVKDAAAGFLFVSPDELSLLSPRHTGGAFTITPG